jgi:ubiquinone/menaquinone biosynthesis C-methylase UbiE
MSLEKTFSWVLFWNQSHSIYANERHLQVHYELVAQSINDHVTSPLQNVLDYGCGDALCAEQVAVRCRHLYLFDTAVSKRTLLQQRLGHVHNISVLDERQLEALPSATLDRVFINSVLQYLTRDQARQSLTTLKEKMAPGAQVLVADVIHPESGVLTDVWALLQLAWKSGFLIAAVMGLLKTSFSNYTVVRRHLGLTSYSEEDFLQMTRQLGFQAERVTPNFGHNQKRMAFRLKLN